MKQLITKIKRYLNSEKNFRKNESERYLAEMLRAREQVEILIKQYEQQERDKLQYKIKF